MILYFLSKVTSFSAYLNGTGERAAFICSFIDVISRRLFVDRKWVVKNFFTGTKNDRIGITCQIFTRFTAVCITLKKLKIIGNKIYTLEFFFNHYAIGNSNSKLYKLDF